MSEVSGVTSENGSYEQVSKIMMVKEMESAYQWI